MRNQHAGNGPCSSSAYGRVSLEQMDEKLAEGGQERVVAWIGIPFCLTEYIGSEVRTSFTMEMAGENGLAAG